MLSRFLILTEKEKNVLDVVWMFVHYRELIRLYFLTLASHWGILQLYVSGHPTVGLLGHLTHHYQYGRKERYDVAKSIHSEEEPKRIRLIVTSTIAHFDRISIAFLR